MSEVSKDIQAYTNCVMDAAASYAIDPKSASVSAGDIADASIAKCALVLSRLQGHLKTLGLATSAEHPDPHGIDIGPSIAYASQTAQDIQAIKRGQAVATVIDMRQKKSN